MRTSSAGASALYRSKEVRGQDWRQGFVCFKHEDEGKGPRMAKRFLELAG
jgi:hypothetical protein